MSWTSTIAKYQATNFGFATKRLVNSLSQPLVGIYEFKVQSLVVTYLQTTNSIAKLCCSALTTFEINDDNQLRKVYQPLHIFELNGRTNTKKVFDCNNTSNHQFVDLDVLEFWLSDMNDVKIVIDLDVLFMYKKL